MKNSERNKKNLEDTNEELAQKLKELEEKIKRKEPKKNKEQAREKFIVIDMETNDETDDVECLIKNKESGYSRSSPQSEPHKKKETMFDFPECGNKFSKREDMVSHQKNHEVSCHICVKNYSKTVNKKILKEHIKSDHDEMICHIQCEGGELKLVAHRWKIHTNAIYVSKCFRAGTFYQHTHIERSSPSKT